jgi:hypothetical protein
MSRAGAGTFSLVLLAVAWNTGCFSEHGYKYGWRTHHSQAVRRTEGAGLPGKGGCMTNVAYVSRVRIERIRGVFRRAWLPARDEPVEFGVHGEVAVHYGVTPDVERTTTLDYVVAAAAG